MGGRPAESVLKEEVGVLLQLMQTACKAHRRKAYVIETKHLCKLLGVLCNGGTKPPDAQAVARCLNHSLLAARLWNDALLTKGFFVSTARVSLSSIAAIYAQLAELSVYKTAAPIPQSASKKRRRQERECDELTTQTPSADPIACFLRDF